MKSWRNAVVGRDTSLQKAIEILDKAALRIVLVVDAGDKLLGIMTDGDVRRALLGHVALTNPVVEVMNSRPLTALQDWPESRMVALMEQHELLHLPVVDNTGRIVELVNLHGVLNRQNRDNPVFLMAGGFGTRLRPLTNSCPKPMLKIGGKPILEQILLGFVAAGFHRFFISTHYMPEVIRNHFGDGSSWGVQIRYIHEEEPLGTGGALGLLPHDEIDHPLFMMNGDLLTSLSLLGFLEFHQSRKAIATLGVREFEYQVPYGVVTNEGAQVKAMVEKPVHRFFVNAGIYLLDPELVRSVEAGTRIDMPSLLEKEIGRGNVVNMFPIHEHWLDVGRMDDFQRAQQENGGY